MEPIIDKQAFRLDWKLVILSMDYFIIFSLPVFMLSVEPGTDIFAFLILFMTLAVSLYTAYRSSGYTIFEPAIASVFFMGILYLVFLLLDLKTHGGGSGYIIMLFTPVCAFVGAWFGERYQNYREKKKPS